MTPILEIRNISKRFPGVLANDKVSFSLQKGEVLAFLGENGAGKTTLMNMLYGLYTPDEGDIYLNGQRIDIESPNDAISHGIGMVHQHFMLVPVMSVVENVVLGDETQQLLGVPVTPFTRRVQAFLHRADPRPLFQHRLAGPYQLARKALTWALSYLVFFALVFLLLFLDRTFAGMTIALFSLFYLLLSFLGGRRPSLPWSKPGRGRWLQIGIALAAALLLAGLEEALGLAGVVSTVVEGILRAGLIVAAAYIGLWLLLGAYLLLWEGLNFLNGLIPLGMRSDAKKVAAISRQFGLDVNPYAMVSELPVGMQQRVEIVKALYRQADILILDEPTAVLTPQEAEELFQVMRSLIDQGKSIIFITHKLKEVLRVADRILVLRGGRMVGEALPKQATEASLAAMMVGREVILTVEKERVAAGEAVLQVENLAAVDERGHPVLRGVSFEVRAGEVLGIAGVQGNGQTELVKALTGLYRVGSGRARIEGVDITDASPRQVSELGVAHVPEDRVKDGLVLSYPIYDNMILGSYYRPPFARGLLIDEDAVHRQAVDLVQTFDVRTPSIATPVRNLSGGNMQKVIVARELSRPIKLLIASQPTRGLDVGSIEFIHKRIIEKRNDGAAVLLVSAELDEIMSLSDRIAVMYEGKILYTVDAAQATREELGLWMAGGPTHPLHGGETLERQPA